MPPNLFSAEKTKKLKKINDIKKRIKELDLNGWLNAKNIPTKGKIDNIIAGMIKTQIAIPDTTPKNTIKIAQMVKEGYTLQDAIDSVLKKRKPMSDETNVPRKRIKNAPETLSEIWYDTFGSFPSEIEHKRFNKIMDHYKLQKDIRKAIKYYKRYVLVLSAYKEDKVNDFWENAKLPNFINYDYITFFIVNWMQNNNSQSVVSRGNNFRSLSLRF